MRSGENQIANLFSLFFSETFHIASKMPDYGEKLKVDHFHMNKYGIVQVEACLIMV